MEDKLTLRWYKNKLKPEREVFMMGAGKGKGNCSLGPEWTL